MHLQYFTALAFLIIKQASHSGSTFTQQIPKIEAFFLFDE